MTPWGTRKITDMSDVVQIVRGVPTARTTPQGEVPVLSVASLASNKEATAFIDMTEIEDVGALVATPGDVLIAVEGGSVSDSFFVTPGTPLFVPSQQAVTVRIIDQAILLPEYLAAWVSSPSAREQLLRLARGAGIQRIALADLASFAIPLAPLDVQAQIGEQMADFANAITEHQRVLRYLNELREIEVTSLFRNQLPPGVPTKPRTKAAKR